MPVTSFPDDCSDGGRPSDGQEKVKQSPQQFNTDPPRNEAINCYAEEDHDKR